MTPKIGDEVHYIPAFGECRPARVIEVGGLLTRTIRGAAGQVVMEESGYAESVVRLNAEGVNLGEVPWYWAEDGETTLPGSWHLPQECRAAPSSGGTWAELMVP